MKELALGQVVRSRAGRDKDLFMIVVGFDNKESDHVFVSDGRLRKIEKPKRKKIKHLAQTNYIVENLREKLNSGEQIQNSELFHALESFNRTESVDA